MAKNKVLVLGFPLDRRAELEVVLNDELKKLKKNCSIVFEDFPDEVLQKMEGVDIVVANVDMCGDFFEKLFSDGYKGGVVAITSCRKQMNKAVNQPGRKSVYPTTFRGAAEEIINFMKHQSLPHGEPELAT